VAYLLSSSALFLSSSLLAGSGRLSAWTGPCLPVSVHPACCILSNRDGVLRTGFALCAFAATEPPLVAWLSSSDVMSVRGVVVTGGWDVPCNWWSEALESFDSFATLSVMPVCVSKGMT